MKRLIYFIKQIFCDHIYGDGIMNPFVDQYGNHSAVYPCIKCGYRKFKTFERR